VGQQVANRHPGGDILIHELEVGQIGANSGIEVELALVDQAHDRGTGVGLGQRADLKAGVGGNGGIRLQAGDTEGSVFLSTIGQDAECCARHLVLLHRRQQSLGDGAEAA